VRKEGGDVRQTRLLACAAMVAAFAFVPAAQAHPQHGHHGHHHGHHGKTKKPRTTVRGIVAHQRALQGIADMSGGTRHTETPGYTASVAYVREKMQRAGLNVTITQFNMPEWRETAPPVFQQLSPTAKTYVPGTEADDGSAAVDYITFEFSPTANVASAPVVPVSDIVIPSPAANSNTAGCEATDFPATTTGAISLIQRGTCPFVQKIANAQAAGAVGVILFNEGDSAGRMNAGFRSGPTDLAIPAVFSSFDVGNELYQAVKAAQNPTVHLQTNGVNLDRFFPQVIAETKKGDPNHVVLAGAHLDSVPAGPGINDDGSGTSWQLDLAEEVAKLKPKNKIRFMWFGGEEDGLVGSQYYAANLTQAEVNRIDVMIDTDMIASPNYVRLVYDGDGDELGPAGPEGSGVIEDVFKRYFQRRGMATLPQAFDGRSDYVGFINRGIPGGGIFAGAEVPKTPAQVAVFGGVAGEQYDPCYHEACDDIDTVTGQPPADTMNSFPTDPVLAQQQADSLNGNALKSLREMSGAVTHAVWFFANKRGVLPPRATTAKAARKLAGKRHFKYEGHRRARTR
jgi:Zn-dependent M28 family amino/carboxypeptidase